MSSRHKIPIDNQELKQAILTTMADKEMTNIMNSTIIQSKSINDIIHETCIPHTTAYRKTGWMVENGLLVVEKIEVSKDGKKFSLLKAVFRSIDAIYENGKVTVEVERNVNTLQEIAQQLFSVDS